MNMQLWGLQRIISKELKNKLIYQKQNKQMAHKKRQFFYIILIKDAGAPPKAWQQMYLIRSTVLNFNFASIYNYLTSL